ncbi:RING-H2 finger protein ATL3 [Cardamine amara subsp. amara]|uniref:RING-type E3 ubiquitin transferase n=1 Tax=Cardamine amara subsp. amara TaxID=228776 RepID=A0ABD1B6P5_CARAN
MDDNGSAHSSMFGDLSTEEVTSKIILTAIIVLFMAVLFVLILHLYAKLYWWRIDQLQQQQQQQQEADQSSTAPAVVSRRRRRFIFVPGQGALSNTGLTPFELSSLPIVLFRQDSCKDGLECSICLSELVKGDRARLLPKCNHCFHVECIDMWFQSHSTCPICRNTVLGPEQASSKRVEQVQDNADVSSSTNNNLDANLSPVSTSSSEFPTNVLVWGRQDQVSTRNTNVGPQEDGGAASQNQEAVILEINDPSFRSQNVSSSSSSSMRYIVEEEEAKSLMTTRLRSLRRFLSRDKRVACSNISSSSSNSNDVASVDP